MSTSYLRGLLEMQDDRTITGAPVEPPPVPAFQATVDCSAKMRGEMNQVVNQSVQDNTWTDGEYTYTELIRQEYGGNNCKFSAGEVEGHPIDTMYLRLEKDGVEPTMLLLRPDEMAAIAWCCTGVLWSHHEADVRPDEPAV